MTSIKNAKQILSSITEALAAGRPVFITDGTVTRKVSKAEITSTDLAHGREGTFDVLLEDGRWAQISINWPWDDLIGYGLANLSDGLFIAPDWWIAL